MQEPKKILAIRFMRLGDIVLLLPALASLKAGFPNAHLTLLVDERCASIGEMCPYIDEVLSVDRLGMRDGPRLRSLKAMARLIADIRRRRFDLVIDFLSFRETNLLSWISGAGSRIGMKRYDRAYLPFCFNLPPVLEDKRLHVSDMFQRIVHSVAGKSGIQPGDSRTLVLPEEIQAWAKQMIPQAPIVALYVGAPVPVRRWPAECFAQVADFAAERLGASVAVLAGASESGIADQVRKLSRNPQKVFVFSQLSIAKLSALIARASLLVSNDTGPMHIGPAVGVRTLGIFSVGYPEHFRPLGEHSRFLRADPIDDVKVEVVLRNVEAMWSEIPRLNG